jgi:peptidylprolyl isomerase
MINLRCTLKLSCVTLIPLIVASCGAKEKKSMSEPIIVMETTQGVVEIQLMPKIAPKACENMIKLAEKGYYDGISFHRIIPAFMIQGGDPEGTGRGGQSIWGRPFEDEFSKEVTFSKPGLLAMANAGPRTNGSQFFITTAATPWLNGNHTIFGEVISGYDVIKKIEAAGTPSGKPKSPQKIIEMYVKSAA